MKMGGLKFFGIQSRIIRKDTKSHNLVRGTCESCNHITGVSTQYSESKERNVKVCDDCLNKHKNKLRQQKGWGTPKGLI